MRRDCPLTAERYHNCLVDLVERSFPLKTIPAPLLTHHTRPTSRHLCLVSILTDPSATLTPTTVINRPSSSVNEAPHATTFPSGDQAGPPNENAAKPVREAILCSPVPSVFATINAL